MLLKLILYLNRTELCFKSIETRQIGMHVLVKCSKLSNGALNTKRTVNKHYKKVYIVSKDKKGGGPNHLVKKGDLN